jgi:hypothetical protein
MAEANSNKGFQGLEQLIMEREAKERQQEIERLSALESAAEAYLNGNLEEFMAEQERKHNAESVEDESKEG